MRIIITLLLGFWTSNLLHSQLVVTTTQSPLQLVQNTLVGGGVAVSNVTFNGVPGVNPHPQIGLFNGVNTTLNMNTGLILSSGQVTNAIGPNTNGSIATMYGAFSADPDLNAISNFAVFDAAILEFDFVPSGDTVKFSFIFGSDEYIEYVGSGINDAFGIFLSGPGISGTFSNGAVNMATVPGTSTPISIDNISPFTNAMYYVDNGNGFTAPYNSNPMYVQYDGLTVKITAAYPVQCGQTYHIKFAIGDGADDFIDSGVFIEGGSFSSNAPSVSLITPTLPNATQGVVYEGCLIGSTVDFTFVRPDVGSNDTVFFNLSGNAINGVDYSLISPSYLVFPPGQDSVTLTISIPNDFVVEGVDTLIISVLGFTACGSQTTNSAALYIHDPYNVLPFAGNDTVYNCPGQTFSYNGVVLNGNPPYNYSWSNSVTGQSINYTITQLGGDTLILSVIDGCGYSGNDTIFYSQVPPAPLFANAGPDTTLLCAGQTVLLQGSHNGGAGIPVTYSWGSAGNTQNILVQPLSTTMYVLSVTNTCNQFDQDTVFVIVPPFVPLSVIVSDTVVAVNCAGDLATFSGQIISGGNPPYSYFWSNMVNDTITTISVLGDTLIALTAVDGCGLDTTLFFRAEIAGGNFALDVSSGRHCLNSDSTALVPFTINGGVAPYSFSWTTPAGVTSITVDILNQNFLIADAQTGAYVYTITDGCGTSITDTSSVIMNSCALDIPNVISPNGDGLNDVFFIDGLQFHPNSVLTVYNRWGQQVYYDGNYQNNWDGNGLSAGTYYYIIELTDGTVPSQYHGTLSILY